MIRSPTVATNVATEAIGRAPLKSTCVFTVMRSLKKHMLLHLGQKPFSCTQCKYSCAQAGTLRQHSLTHSKEKSFSCSQCNYSCRTAFALKNTQGNIQKRTHSSVNYANILPRNMLV